MLLPLQLGYLWALGGRWTRTCGFMPIRLFLQHTLGMVPVCAVCLLHTCPHPSCWADTPGMCECDRGNRNPGRSFWMVNRLRWFSFLLLCVFSSWLFCLLILHFIFQFSSLAVFTCLSPLLSFSLSEHTHPLPVDASGATLTLYPSFQI